MQKWSSDGTRLERTGWRDEAISKRHRAYGFDCPCIDVDFLLVEYHIAEPIALVEYKHYQAAFPNLQQASYRALKRLAEKSNLPFLLAFYWPGSWAFRVYPLNALGFSYFQPAENLTEYEYVARLHRMHGIALNNAMKKNFNTIKPTLIKGEQ